MTVTPGDMHPYISIRRSLLVSGIAKQESAQCVHRCIDLYLCSIALRTSYILRAREGRARRPTAVGEIPVYQAYCHVHVLSIICCAFLLPLTLNQIPNVTADRRSETQVTQRFNSTQSDIWYYLILLQETRTGQRTTSKMGLTQFSYVLKYTVCFDHLFLKLKASFCRWYSFRPSCGGHIVPANTKSPEHLGLVYGGPF